MGMTNKEYADEFREFWFKIGLKPAAFLIAIVIVGSLVNAILKIFGQDNAFLVGLGVVPFLIEYYFYAKKNMLRDIGKQDTI